MKRLILLIIGLFYCISTAPGFAATGDIFVDRSNPLPHQGETFTATITADSGTVALGGYALDITYDSTLFTITGISGASGFVATPVTNNISFSSGQVRVIGTQGLNLLQPDGLVSIMTLTFSSLIETSGYSPININKITLFDTDGAEIQSGVDSDGDSVSDAVDNCPSKNNTDQVNTDGDNIGNACDDYPNDSDNDGFEEDDDNCPYVYNPGKTDTDGDGMGDACDPDDDNDGLTDVREAALGTDSLADDTDGDGYKDGEEVNQGTDPKVQDEKATLTVETDKDVYLPSEQVSIKTTIDNQGIDIVNGALSLKIVKGDGTVTSKTWSNQVDFKEWNSSGIDRYSTPGQITLLSFDDNFDHPQFNFDRWSVINQHGPNGIMTIEDNRLKLVVTPTEDYKTLGVRSKYRIEGDFSVEIDWYDFVNFDDAHYGHLGPELTVRYASGLDLVYIKRVDNQGYQQYYRGVHNSNGALISNEFKAVSTTDSSGKFKIERRENIIKTYYHNGTAWVELKRADGANTIWPLSPLVIEFKIYNDDDPQKTLPAEGASVSFDNLKIVTPDDTYVKTGTCSIVHDSGIDNFDWGTLNWSGERGCASEGLCSSATLFSDSLLLGDGSEGNNTSYTATFNLDHLPVEDIRLFVGATSVYYGGGTSVVVNNHDLGGLVLGGDGSEDYTSSYKYIAPGMLQQGENTITITSNSDDIWLKEISILEGTIVRFRTRSADTTEDLASATWSEYISIPDVTTPHPPGQYIQIQAELETSNTDTSPSIDMIRFTSSENPEDRLIWESETPVNITQETKDNSSFMAQLSELTGYHRLIGNVLSSNGTSIDSLILPFYVLEGATTFTTQTDKDTYVMSEPVLFSGSLKQVAGQAMNSTIPCNISIYKEGVLQGEIKDGEVVYLNPYDQMPFSLTWSTLGRESGDYHYIVSADTAAGILTSEGDFTVTNQAPTLVEIPDITLYEGEEIVFAPNYTDPDGNTLTVTYTGWMDSGTYQTGSDDVGTHTVLVTVSDGVLSTTQEVTVTVNNVNNPPVIDMVDYIEVREGDTVFLIPTITDPDNDTVTVTYSGWMDNAVYTTGYEDSGFHIVTITASDNEYTTSFDVLILVNNVNRAPVLDPIGNQSVLEGETLSFNITGSDPDDDAIYFDAGDLPTGSMFDADSQTFDWSPDYTMAGTYPGVLFRIIDTGIPPLSDSESITVSVGNVNRPPVISPIDDAWIWEGETIVFSVSANDPDNDELIYSASNLPRGAVFDSDLHQFTWTPGFDQAGNYPDIYFTVTDDGDTPLTVTESVQITVGDVNRPPVIDPIGNRQVDEGELLAFTVTATDPDEDDLTWSAAWDQSSTLPEGASFDPLTQQFTWTPNYDQGGVNYENIHFTVTDNGLSPASDTASIMISVGNVNRPPMLNPMGDITVHAGDVVHGFASASDPDGDTVTYSLIDNPPDGMVINPDTGEYSWTPTTAQLGNHLINIQAEDSWEDTDTTDFTITVLNPVYAISAIAEAVPDTLWPPLYQMVDVHVTVTVTGTADPNPEIILTSIDDSDGIFSDIQDADFGTPDFDFKLRAQRTFFRTMRVYTITYTVTDQWGNTTTAVDYVRVPVGL